MKWPKIERASAYTDQSIRIWRSLDVDCRLYHLSVGSSSNYQEILRKVGRHTTEYIGGYAWDEILGLLAKAMLAPGAMLPARYYEPPANGGFELLIEIRPLGGSEFDVLFCETICTRLNYGEALAMFVLETIPRGWRGFGRTAHPQFALQRVEAFPFPGSLEWFELMAFHYQMQRSA